MRDIRILNVFPIIFTKDVLFLKKITVAKAGSIILLPEDAVLLMPKPAPLEKLGIE